MTASIRTAPQATKNAHRQALQPVNFNTGDISARKKSREFTASIATVSPHPAADLVRPVAR